MQRILTIGPCGAGKSTLARDIAARLDLPIYHMDQLHWRPGWVEGTTDELRAKLEPIIASDRWVIDGNYGGTLDMRAARADTVIHLDFPITLCLARIIKRVWRHKGRARADMPEGCPERFSFQFLAYVAHWNSRNGPGARTKAKLVGHEHKIIRLRNPKEVAAWLGTLESRTL